jgi:hypothetical protein
VEPALERFQVPLSLLASMIQTRNHQCMMMYATANSRLLLEQYIYFPFTSL